MSIELELVRRDMIDCGTNWVRFLASGYMVKVLLSTVERTDSAMGVIPGANLDSATTSSGKGGSDRPWWG